MSADDCTKVDPGYIRFYDDYVPTLEIGTYLINVAQKIAPPGADPECHVGSQAFSVAGPRYSIPPDDIASIFPPENALGNFDQYLPHIVLSKQDLPWERNIFEDTPQTPWMALLLFVADEEIDNKKSLRPPNSMPANRTLTATISARRFKDHQSQDTDVAWPGFTPEWYEEEILDTTECDVIDVSAAAFRALMPSPADLRSLVHVRKVDPSAKESAILKISPKGTYSVLVGKRMPVRREDVAVRYIAHLVSLEGWEDYITGSKSPAKAYLRMIAFKSWTFECAPRLREDFTHLMNDLLRQAKQQNAPVGFRLPLTSVPDGSEESQYAWDAVHNGYAPLRYQTRQGEETFGWYRGPFSPVPVKKFVIPDESSAPGEWLFFDRASAAMIYDKKYGVFDLSYALAWETGRLLALSNKTFGQALLEWQRRGHSMVDRVVERQNQISLMPPRLMKGTRNLKAGLLGMSVAQVRQQCAVGSVTHGFVHELLTDFSGLIKPAKSRSRGKLKSAPGFERSFFDSRPPLACRPSTHAMLAAPGVRALVQAEGVKASPAIVDFLADLYLLMNVPFETLVPHAAMLPPESVRFFHIDSNWMDALLEGAMSIGVESSRDLEYQKLMKDSIRAAICKASKGKRQAIASAGGGLLRTAGADSVNPQKMTGMLLRSAVVSGWPGLEANAYCKIKPTDLDPAAPDLDNGWIQPLRIERLSPDVLLCIWSDVPAVVTIDEPHEGVAFGFEDAPLTTPASASNRYLYLRRLTPDKYGQLFPKEDGKYFDAQPFVDASSQLKISELQGQIKTGVGASALNVRDCAVEMIRVPQQAVFAWKNRDGGTHA
jgi:hypothetical protein